MKRLVYLLVIIGILLTGACIGSPGGGYSADDDFYEAKGSSEVTKVEDFAGSGITAYDLYYPADLVLAGAVVWAHGFGGGMLPATYEGLHEHFASHGFIILVAKTSVTASITLTMGISILEDAHDDPESPLYQKWNGDVVVMGHSMGGGAATQAGSDKQVTAIAAIEPWQHTVFGFNGPIIWVTGTEDTQLPPPEAKNAFNATKVPTVLVIAAGAGHYEPVGYGGMFRGALTAWLYDQLEGDPKAYNYLWGPGCDLCNDKDYEVQSKE